MTASMPAPSAQARPCAIPPLAGIGLKPQHFAHVLEAAEAGGDAPAWVEIHPQNYFVDGGPMLRWLDAIAQNLPVSYHSTGLSLGSADGPDMAEAGLLAALMERIAPAQVSDHLSWSNTGDEILPDLLPLPYTYEVLDLFARAVDAVQTRLGRTMLVENPSRYLAFAEDEMDEVSFLHHLCEKTGCGLLFDINNVVVSATNLGFAPEEVIDAIDPSLVGEIHLAGHATEDHGDFMMAIDDHGSAVEEATWALFDRFVARSGPRPTLIEWDTDTPDIATLMAEAAKADTILKRHSELPHAA